MKTKLDLKNIINDYLQGRLSETDRQKFISLYLHLIRKDQKVSSDIFDDIHRQVDALSDEELKTFIELMDAPDHSHEKAQHSARFVSKVCMRIAAAIVLISSIGYLVFYHASKQPNTRVFTVQHDKLIWLPDSSSVYLKAGSAIRLTKDYGALRRELLIEGEGFFKVKPDSERPFIVRTTSGFYTQVLGTSFLMHATPDMHRVEVKTGKVQVGDSLQTFAILLPGDKISRDKNGVISLDLEQRLPPARIIQFTGQKLKDIVQTLEEYYDQEIVLADKDIAVLEYTATFSMDQPLDEIISVLCELHDLEHELKDNKIIITNH